jgi:hypothetical protein
MRFAPSPLAHHLSPCRSQLIAAAFVDPPRNYPGARPKVLLNAVPADVEIDLAKVRRAWAGALCSDGYQRASILTKIATTLCHDGGDGPSIWPLFPPPAEY